MSPHVETTGWLPSGFEAWVALWLWTGLVLAHGLFWRSLARPEPDAIRPAGPLPANDASR